MSQPRAPVRKTSSTTVDCRGLLALGDFVRFWWVHGGILHQHAAHHVGCVVKIDKKSNDRIWVKVVGRKNVVLLDASRDIEARLPGAPTEVPHA